MDNKMRFGLIDLAGVAAPILFVGVLTILGAVRPDYNPLTMYVSALSLGSLGWIQIANFLIFGAFQALFTFSVISRFQHGSASKALPVLFFAASLCFFFSGPFVMDPMGTPQAAMSIQGTVHGILGAIVFLLMPVICFVTFIRLRREPRLHGMKWWTLASGIVISLAVVMLSVVSKGETLAPIFADWFGLIQRCIIIPYMAWLCTFALSLFIEKTRDRQQAKTRR
jgi:hypothetical protein